MAASIAKRFVLSLPKHSSSSLSRRYLLAHQAMSVTGMTIRRLSRSSVGQNAGFQRGHGMTAVMTAAVVGTATFVWARHKFMGVAADSGQLKAVRPVYQPSRSVKSNTDDTGLKLTLYQYQTCPFCCKLRAYLDYRGFSYDVIEVNSVWRTQIKWSQYKKVPILVVEGQGPAGFMQLNDSSVITSILESFLVNRKESVETLNSYYPALESKNAKGKTVYEYPNRFFLMYGDMEPTSSAEALKEERNWRRWTDDHLVHMLSPNVYRTPSEALQAFRYFSDAGEWEKHFSLFERKLVIYVGAAAMYFIGKRLVKKYNLKSDVRQSLYDACNEWTKAIGKTRLFMGGDEPNLSDVSVYGVLSSIEGCSTFDDLLQHTNIGAWYGRMRRSVNSHQGASTMTNFTHE